MKNCTDLSFTTTRVNSPEINIIGINPIKVVKSKAGTLTNYQVSITETTTSNGNDGQDGKDGVDGHDGISPTIEVGQVTQGTNAQVTNTGTPDKAVFNFVLPQGNKGNDGDTGPKGDPGDKGDPGEKGDPGSNGVTAGIKAYFFSAGGTTSNYSPMGNFQQGTYVDTGDNSLKRIKVRAYVTVANMQNWTTLRLISSNNPGFSGTLISQRVKHSEASLYVGQHEINGYISTTDRYIGFTFSDTPGGNYNSDGAQYGDYGIEVFILS